MARGGERCRRQMTAHNHISLFHVCKDLIGSFGIDCFQPLSGFRSPDPAKGQAADVRLLLVLLGFGWSLCWDNTSQPKLIAKHRDPTWTWYIGGCSPTKFWDGDLQFHLTEDWISGPAVQAAPLAETTLPKAMWELWTTSKEWSLEVENFSFYGSFPILEKKQTTKQKNLKSDRISHTIFILVTASKMGQFCSETATKTKKKGKSNYWAGKKKSKIALSFTCSLSRSYWSGSVCHATKGWSETVFLSVNQMQIQEISPSSCHRSEQMLMQRPRGVLRTGMLQTAFLEDTAVPQDSFLTAPVGLCRCWWNHWGIELPMLCNPPHAVTVVSLKIS